MATTTLFLLGVMMIIRFVNNLPYNTAQSKNSDPVMKVDVEIPEPFVGAISGYVSRKRGLVSGTNVIGEAAVVSAEVPLDELFDCAEEIRSMTQGQGTFVMTPIGFRQMPKSVEDAML